MELRNIIIEYIKNNEKYDINYIETIDFIIELLNDIKNEFESEVK